MCVCVRVQFMPDGQGDEKYQKLEAPLRYAFAIREDDMCSRSEDV